MSEPNALEIVKHKKQLDILGSIQTAGYNVVNCGDCGDLLLICMNEYEHECIYCGFIGEHSDFPDWITVRSAEEIMTMAKWYKRDNNQGGDDDPGT